MIACAIRVGVVLTRPTNDAALAVLPDQTEYLALGRSVLRDRAYALYDARFGQTVYAYRTPGYPLLIAACGGSVRVVRIVQALLDTSAVLATFLLARRWLRDGAALVAAALIAFDPFLIYFTGLILSETLFTALLTWGLWAASRAAAGRQIVGWLFLALGVLVRPAAMLLPISLGVIACAVAQEGRRSRRWAPLAWSVLSLAVVLLPWAARNARVLGRPVVAGTNGGITLYDGYRPNADGGSDQSFVATMPELWGLGELGRDDALTTMARREMFSNPARTARLAVKKLARTWSPVPLSADYGRPAYRLIGLAFYVPLFALAIVGLLRPNLPAVGKVWLLTPIVYFSLVHALTVGSLRYRVPIDPALAVLAGGGVRWRAQSEDGGRARRGEGNEGNDGNEGKARSIDFPS